MDENLKIRITIAGQKELNDLIKKVNEGNASLEDLRKIKRALSVEQAKQVTDSQSDIRLSEEIVKVKERISAATDKLLTKKARERDEYFKTGLQLRQGLLPLMGDLQGFLRGGTQGAQSFSSSFSNVSNTVTNVSQSFVTMIAKGHTVQEVLKGLVSSLAGPTGIVLGIGIVSSLAASFADDLFPSAKKVADEMQRIADIQDEIYKNLVRAGAISIDDQIKLAEAQRVALQTELQVLQKGKEETTVRHRTQGDIVTKRILKDEEAILKKVEELSAKEADIVALKKEQADLSKKAADDAKKKTDDAKKAADELWKITREREALAAEFAAARALQGPGKGISPDPFNLGLGKGKPPGLSKGQQDDEKADAFGLKMAEKKVNAFQYAFTSATSAISQSISSKIGGAFASVFGGANSMLGQFAANFASTLTDILLQLGIRTGLAALGLPVIPMAGGGIISEPVLGRGLQSGRMYSFAERGPERVIPNGNQIGQSSRFGGSGGGMIQPSITVVPIESNYGLAVRVEVGNKQKTAYRMGS